MVHASPNDSCTTLVSLSTCQQYSNSALDLAIDSVIHRELLPVNLTGAVILLKPNLISSMCKPLACTNAAFLAAVVRWFIDHGARVKIGDSPAFGSVKAVMKRQGMEVALQGLAWEQVRFVTPIKKTLTNGEVIEVAAEAFEQDLLVNLPKIKAHNQMYVTGAVKNLFGTVVGVRKAMLHMKNGKTHDEFADILVRIPQLFPSLFNICDGVEVMHRSGPIDGDALQLNCVGSCLSAVALDSALLKVLELPPWKSPIWKAADKQQMTGSRLDELRYPLLGPESFYGSGFVDPPELNPVRFSALRMVNSGLRRLRLAIGERM